MYKNLCDRTKITGDYVNGTTIYIGSLHKSSASDNSLISIIYYIAGDFIVFCEQNSHIVATRVRVAQPIIL